MRYAFSNLACPTWSITRTIEAARDMGYNGIELRLLDGEVIDPVANQGALEQIVDQIRVASLDVCALDSSCRFNLPDAGERARQIAALEEWIALASFLKVPLVRVFGGADSPDMPRETGDTWVVDALRQAAVPAEQAAVTVVLETHDGFSSARRVARVLDRVGSPRIQALWDSHHPYRVGETVDDVVAALGSRIAHVHVKDARRSRPDEENWQLVELGDGEVPVRAQLAALWRAGYNGWVSVEWEKKWHPEIDDPELALPRHIAWLKQAMG